MKVLLIVGGLNWGLVGVALLLGNGSNWNVVNLLLGSWPIAEGVVYVLVGLAAALSMFCCRCKDCVQMCASCDSSKNGESTDNVM